MGHDRLSHARGAGLRLPETGRIALFNADADAVLPADPARLHAVQSFRPDHDALAARGVDTATTPAPPYAAVIVTLPRARDHAESLIADACAAAPGGLVVVDGAKTDGMEAMVKALKQRVTLQGVVSKAHGKVAWFAASSALDDWARPAPAPNADGDMIAPGLFSADGADPGSRVLAAALPPLKGSVADLGAGWGWLGRAVLRHPGVTALHMVEAEQRALDCARINAADPRAVFHWADATRWRPEEPVGTVVTNPPFHIGRKADPEIGRAFIDAAAAMLTQSGDLWLVANRHLPYEPRLQEAFRDVTEAGGDSKFKVLHARRPVRTTDRKGRG